MAVTTGHASRTFGNPEAWNNVVAARFFDADLLAFIFREEVYKLEDEALKGRAEIIISKQRNGPTGKIEVCFLHKYAKFDNLAEPRS